ERFSELAAVVNNTFNLRRHFISRLTLRRASRDDRNGAAGPMLRAKTERLLRGMKTRFRDQGRTAAVGSVKRPSRERGATGEQLCSLGLGSPIACAASRLALRATARCAPAALTRPARWALDPSDGRSECSSVQLLPSRSMALRVVSILRMTATIATFGFLPTPTRRRW